MRFRAARDMIRVAADWSLVENGADNAKTGRATTGLILILVLLLFDGGFGYSEDLGQFAGGKPALVDIVTTDNPACRREVPLDLVVRETV